MGTSNKLWKDLDFVKPLKSFSKVFYIVVSIITILGFILIFFPDETKSISKWKILENYNMEFGYLIIIIILLLFSISYIFNFFRYNFLKFYGVEAVVNDPNYSADGKIKNLGNLRCVLYSNLPAYYKICNKFNKEQFRLEGHCNITNISDSIVFISSIGFKDNFTGAFDVWDSHGENSINPHQLANVKFWGYVDISVFKPKRDIITDVIITDNFSVDYTLRNIRFRCSPNEEKNK